MKILIDPGHGGKDPGAVNPNRNIREKDITLDIALQAGALLRDMSYMVLFTRDRDRFLTPYERLNLIGLYGPHAFISIHCNASINPDASGIETLYRDDDDYFLASQIHICLLAETRLRDRGIKNDIDDLKRRLTILGNLPVPSCLCEIGFITSDKDLNAIENHEGISAALAAGIHAWALDNTRPGNLFHIPEEENISPQGQGGSPWNL